MTPRLTRRDLLAWAALLPGCGVGFGPKPAGPSAMLPVQTPSREPQVPSPYADAVDALFDVLLPAEPGSVGAREAGVDRVLEEEDLVRFAIAQGLLRPLPETVLTALDDLGGAARAMVNRALDARAQLEQPLKRFRDLDRATQERIAEAAFDDEATKPAMLALRAACFLAWLGAITSDAGLREVGFPPFEDFEAGIASSGFADYSVNRAPAATPGDDLLGVLTPEGDLR